MDIITKPTYWQPDYYVELLSASDIEDKGIYFQKIVITENLYNLIVNYYENNNFFWKQATSINANGSISKTISYGLLFSLCKEIDINDSTSYYINQYNTENAPEEKTFSKTPEDQACIEKINFLKSQQGSYYSIYRLIAGVLKKYHFEILSITVWEHYLRYKFSSEVTGKTSLLSCVAIDALKGYKQPRHTAHSSSSLYDTFSGDGSNNTYLGDGLWISPSGDISDEGR